MHLCFPLSFIFAGIVPTIMAVAIATSSPDFSSLALARLGRSWARRMGWALLLSLVLLFSQFLGLLHGIAHAGWPPAMERVAEASFNAAVFNYIDDDDGDADEKALGAQSAGHQKHHHSCVEYDAASGTPGIHAHFFSPPLIPGVQVLALWQAFASWDAPVVCHFSSRAPPH